MAQQGEISDCAGPCPAPPQLQLYQAIVFATPVLFALLLLLLFCVLYVRRSRNAGNSSQASTQFVDIGFISTSHRHDPGLSKSFRQRLPTISFDETFAASHEDNQCAVCLGDYQLNDKLQQLPVCNHSFHVQCIDEWLRKSTTCPMCRNSLLQDGKKKEQESQAVGGENSRRWEDMVVNEAVQGAGSNGNRADVPSGASSNGIASSSPAAASGHLTIEHLINIERS